MWHWNDMAIFTWIIRLLVVLFLTAFAIKNAEIVTLKTFFGYEWQAPLILALFAFFIGGVVIGFLGLLGPFFQLKRENSQLKRTIEKKEKDLSSVNAESDRAVHVYTAHSVKAGN
jgi:putative membrane protein